MSASINYVHVDDYESPNEQLNTEEHDLTSENAEVSLNKRSCARTDMRT